MKLTKSIAALLVKSLFGKDFQFFITGSIVTAITEPQDIDFVVVKSEFESRLAAKFDWEFDSDYAEEDTVSNVVTIDGIKFNAIVAKDAAIYRSWYLATIACAALPATIRAADKKHRVGVFQAVREAFAAAAEVTA